MAVSRGAQSWGWGWGVKWAYSCHTFRHSSATPLLKQGQDMLTNQEPLDHPDVRTIMTWAHALNSWQPGSRSPADFASHGVPVVLRPAATLQLLGESPSKPCPDCSSKDPALGRFAVLGRELGGRGGSRNRPMTSGKDADSHCRRGPAETGLQHLTCHQLSSETANFVCSSHGRRVVLTSMSVILMVRRSSDSAQPLNSLATSG